MKKTYIIPRTLVVDLGTQSNILAGSGLPTNITTPGISNAKKMNIFEEELNLDGAAEEDF